MFKVIDGQVFPDIARQLYIFKSDRGDSGMNYAGKLHFFRFFDPSSNVSRVFCISMFFGFHFRLHAELNEYLTYTGKKCVMAVRPLGYPPF